MVGIIGGSGGGGFDYVQDPNPQDPSEGEEWYDTGSDSAFVYTGSAWVEQTITAHDKLSGVTGSQHHAKTTDHSELTFGSSDHHNRPTSATPVYNWIDAGISFTQTSGGFSYSIPSGVYDYMLVTVSNQNGFRCWLEADDGTKSRECRMDQNGDNKFIIDTIGQEYDYFAGDAGGAGVDLSVDNVELREVGFDI